MLEGKLEGQAGTVAKLLQLKFQKKSKEYLPKLEAMTSEQLDIITERILIAPSLGEVFEGL